MPDENNRSVTNQGDANDSILASGDHNVIKVIKKYL